MNNRHIAMIGAGSWGTALSMLLARNGHSVRLWARRPEFARQLERQRENSVYLPGVSLPEAVTPVEDLDQAVSGAWMVVLAVPSRGMRDIVGALARLLQPDQCLVSAAKGLEDETGLRMSEIIAQVIPSLQDRIVVLSGPNLAAEVAAGIASATVVASQEEGLAREVQQAFMHPTFRVYTNPDLIGVELGGALKHTIAIAAGVNDGLGFGDNTKAALVTRGLIEMIRLGVALGARAETFHGLSGLGDLVATCAGQKSRNHYVGYQLAQGRRLEEILAEMVMVAEGVPTTHAAWQLANRQRVEMPIREVYQLLFEGKSPKQAVADLMMRVGRSELEGD